VQTRLRSALGIPKIKRPPVVEYGARSIRGDYPDDEFLDRVIDVVDPKTHFVGLCLSSARVHLSETGFESIVPRLRQARACDAKDLTSRNAAARLQYSALRPESRIK